MKLSSSLIALAATVAPIYAQQGAATPLADTMAAVQAPAAPKASAAQRAAALPALALIPQDVSLFISTGVNDITTGWAQNLGTEGPASVAFGATTGSMEVAMKYLIAVTSALNVDPYGDAIEESVIKVAKETAGQKITPCYLVITASPYEISQILEQFAETCKDAIEEGGEGISAIQVDGLTGICVDWDTVFASNAQDIPEALRAVYQGRKVNVVAGVRGNAIVFAVAQDAADIKVPASADESVLATDKLSDTDKCIDKNVLGYAYIAPELLSSWSKTYAATLESQIQSMLTLLTMNADITPEQKAALSTPVDRLTALVVGMYKPYFNCTQPSAMTVWMDGDFHLEITGDAFGCSFDKSPLKHVGMAQDPSTTLYIESPKTNNPALPSVTEVYDSLESLAFALADICEDDPQVQQGISFYQVLRPQIIEAGRGLSTIGDGLSGHATFVLRENPDVFVEGALSLGVTNRAKLEEGWQMTLQAVGNGMAAFGLNPEMVNTLPITAKTGPAGSACYGLVLPIPMPKGIAPNIMLNDTNLVFGSNEGVSTKVMGTSSATIDFPGAVFSFSPASAARIAQALADQKQAQLDAISSSFSEEGDDDLDEGEDYEEEYSFNLYNEYSKPAALLESFAAQVGPITGAIIVKDGKSTLRIDAKLAK